MKVIIVALAFVAIAVGAAVEPHAEIKILRSEYDQKPEGGYSYSFETENGIQRVENGEVKEALDEENKPHPVLAVRGSYSYPNEEGKLVSITYYADETGYHAEGDAIPKLPSRR